MMAYHTGDVHQVKLTGLALDLIQVTLCGSVLVLAILWASM